MKNIAFDKYELSYEMDKLFEWRKWVNEIPPLSFPSHWQVQITPPFGGAVIRFRVSLPNTTKDISVYLDCYDLVGYYGKPYWEIYPHEDDTFRCAMEDTEGLLKAIGEALERG